MRVFVDTSAWIAQYDQSDEHHHAALQIAHQLRRDRARFILSEFILAESVTLLRYRMGHPSAVRFGRAVLQSRVAELLVVSEAMRSRAWQIFEQYDDKDFSFVDCTSFSIMEHVGVKTAFAFDKHFGQYGFEVLRPNG